MMNPTIHANKSSNIYLRYIGCLTAPQRRIYPVITTYELLKCSDIASILCTSHDLFFFMNCPAMRGVPLFLPINNNYRQRLNDTQKV